jgi:hypothetical protein
MVLENMDSLAARSQEELPQFQLPKESHKKWEYSLVVQSGILFVSKIALLIKH